MRRRAVSAALLVAVAGCDPPQSAATDRPPSRPCLLSVALRPATLPARVGVALEQNDFDPDAAPLQRDADGVWRATVTVPPGRNLYHLVVDGRHLLDADNPLTLMDDGVEHSVFYAADCGAPALAAEQWAATPAGRLDLVLRFLPAGAPLEPGSARATIDDQPVSVTAHGDRLAMTAAGLAPGKHHVRVRARDTRDRDAELFRAPFWIEREQFRWEDAVIYQVITDRFAAGDGPLSDTAELGERFGGDLRGLLRVLRDGYFENLGVNVLWISPLNDNPEERYRGVEGGPPRYVGYHGYWPAAPREMEPAFGTPEDALALVAEAHARGIRVIMDVVLNHVHITHPYVAAHPGWFNEACVCGTAHCPWSSHIETCWFADYLPDLSWRDAEITETQIDDAVWWLERFDLDGLRLDAVPMMPRFVTRQLTDRVHRRFERLRTRHYLLGESFTGPGGYGTIRWYLGRDGLDGQFDFPLMWAIRDVLAWERAPMWALDDALRASADAWAGSTAVMGVFIGNHDLPRFISEAAGQIRPDVREQAFSAPPPPPSDGAAYDRLFLAHALTFTVPGAPVIYYGDELGLPGAGDPDNRRPMRFDPDRSPRERALFDRVARLGRLRRCLPALRRGRLVPLRAERERYGYLRDAGDGAPAVIVLNREGKPATVRLLLPPDLDAPATFVDALSGARTARSGDTLAPIEVEPRSAAVLIPASSPCLEESP